jgi:2'-deoxynucleoside 5'-phosphate N-hydrolase
MEIYFACSITGGRQDEAAYEAIVAALISAGHTIPTAHLALPGFIQQEAIIDPQEIYTRDTNWIAGCQALIAEVSTPSHGVGYEIAYALHQDKPVLCCYRQGARVSKMILGNTHPNLRVVAYKKSTDIQPILTEFLNCI